MAPDARADGPGSVAAQARREFAERCEALLAPLGPVRARAMFGGHGLYLGDVMFALIADETLYLKADEVNREDFERAGLEAFVYDTATRPVATSYRRAPEPIDDWARLEPWVRGSLDAAHRARAARRPRRRRQGSGGRGGGSASGPSAAS